MDATNNTQDPTNLATGPKPAKQKWSLKKKLIVIFGAIVAIIAVLLIIINAATAAPVKVSNQLVADIQAKNATSAYSLLSKEAKNATDPQAFQATVDQIGPILTGKPNMKSKEVNAQTGNASTAKVVYEIQGNDGLVYVFTVNLVKEDDSWKVMNFESTKKSGGSSDSSSSSSPSVSVNKEVQDKCLAEVKDATFCKFAGAFANVSDYSAIMTSVSDGTTTVANMAISASGNSSMTVKENGTTSANIVFYDGSTYIQDPSDQQWFKYTAADAPAVLDIKKEFLATGFKDDSGTSNQFVNKGTETIDGKECYKYQVIETDKPDQQGFMWFDKDSFLLRKLSNVDGGTVLSMTFSYDKVSISQPSPIKATP